MCTLQLLYANLGVSSLTCKYLWPKISKLVLYKHSFEAPKVVDKPSKVKNWHSFMH